MRSALNLGSARDVAVSGSGVSLSYARHWLEQVGVVVTDDVVATTRVVLSDGRSDDPTSAGVEIANPVRIRLWDFQVGFDGTGVQASAVAGVSYVLGHPGRPPLALPADIPEKWCGLFAASLALSSLVEIELGRGARNRVFDISSADILRAFADQNAGNHGEVVAGWRRNGRVAVEHGGIYPQGFFECRDGFVAIVGRSRKDWVAIREMLEWPAWAREDRFDDPFRIASDSSEVDALLTDELRKYDRDDLLERALKFGATVAPVYDLSELRDRSIVRDDFFDPSGRPSLPFRVRG